MMNSVTTSILIDRRYRLSAVFDRLKKLEEYPDIMPDVKHVKVLSRDKDGGASEWDVDIDGCPLHWRERDSFDDLNRIFRFRSIEGDFDTLNGNWSVHEDEDGIRVEFQIEYLIGIPVIEDIIGPVLDEHLENNSMKMLKDLKRKVESEDFPEERAEPRRPVDFTATLLYDGRSEVLRVTDLSENGAGIEYLDGLTLDRAVTLIIPDDPESSNIQGNVVWVGNGSRRAGIRFIPPKKT